jgi:uncharacterized membrane protein
MNEILPTIVRALTYDGDTQAMIINYALLVMTLAPFLLGTVIRRGAWIICFIVITILQVIMWFAADAIGVSLIWAAMAGFLALTYANKRADQSALVIGVLVLAFAGIVFYGVTYPITTTIAHVVAVLVGVVVYLITADMN